MLSKHLKQNSWCLYASSLSPGIAIWFKAKTWKKHIHFLCTLCVICPWNNSLAVPSNYVSKLFLLPHSFYISAPVQATTTGCIIRIPSSISLHPPCLSCVLLTACAQNGSHIMSLSAQEIIPLHHTQNKSWSSFNVPKGHSIICVLTLFDQMPLWLSSLLR